METTTLEDERITWINRLRQIQQVSPADVPQPLVAVLFENQGRLESVRDRYQTVEQALIERHATTDDQGEPVVVHQSDDGWQTEDGETVDDDRVVHVGQGRGYVLAGREAYQQERQDALTDTVEVEVGVVPLQDLTDEGVSFGALSPWRWMISRVGDSS